MLAAASQHFEFEAGFIYIHIAQWSKTRRSSSELFENVPGRTLPLFHLFDQTASITWGKFQWDRHRGGPTS